MGIEHGWKTNLKSIIVDQYGPSWLLIIGQIKFSEMFPEFVWQSVVFHTHSYRYCSARDVFCVGVFRVNVPLSYVCSGFGGGDLNLK